jgi:hypothetical protein
MMANRSMITKIWTVCLALCAMPVQAQPYAHHWQAAMEAPSPRLRLFALMAERPQGAGQAVAALQKGQGFAHLAGQGPQIVASGVSLGPVLRYDNNINGGTPGDTILIGGLPFTISPDARAISGMVFGAEAGGSLRLSLSPRTTP